MPPFYKADNQILFIDMNSFFASCEQADNLELRDKPVIVIPTKNSCALSASYEAKAYGIKTGTPEREARFICPGLKVVLARPKRYMEYHHSFAAILNDLTPHVTMRSVDEASIKLCRNEEPLALGQEMKEAIWQKLSPAINCSIGIGPNIFLAKLGTELQKPNGLVNIKLSELEKVYKQVKLLDLCGINIGLERQLNNIGICSVLDFYHADPSYLRQHLGVIGYRWWLQLQGFASYDHINAPRRTLSHSHVLPPKYRAPQAAYTTLHHIISKVGRRLRQNGYLAGQIALSLRLLNNQGKSYQDYKFFNITPAADTISLVHHIQRLWQIIDPKQPILQIAIWTNNLVQDSEIPAPLFEDDHKRLRLAQALDTINDRFGHNMIRLAITDTSGSRAPDRISFTALFDIEQE